jgi:hypothetical protein
MAQSKREIKNKNGQETAGMLKPIPNLKNHAITAGIRISDLQSEIKIMILALQWE